MVEQGSEEHLTGRFPPVGGYKIRAFSYHLPVVSHFLSQPGRPGWEDPGLFAVGSDPATIRFQFNSLQTRRSRQQQSQRRAGSSSFQLRLSS
ncbi:hypothetical protein SBA2_900007 [Acidobacteriia bacterium SbA2]|nr:hypothetical protein SBA2_900007 [Acidobacteriia bacterium SbA2]